MSLEDLVKVTNNQQWTLDKTSGEVRVTEKRGFIGRVVDWLRGFNKHSEVFAKVAQEIGRDDNHDYDHTKAKVELGNRVVEQSTEYYNKTTFVGRFLRGNGDVAYSAKEVSDAVYTDLYNLFGKDLEAPVADRRAFAKAMYTDLTNLDSTPTELETLKKFMQQHYGANAEARLQAFADLGYPVARFLLAENTIESMENFAKEGFTSAKYRLAVLSEVAAEKGDEMAKIYAEKSHKMTADLGRNDDEMFLEAGVHTLIGFGTVVDAHAAMLIAEEVLSTPDLPEELRERAGYLETAASTFNASIAELTQKDLSDCLEALNNLLLSRGQRNAFLNKLEGEGNAVASYLLYLDTRDDGHLRNAAAAELPLAQTELAYKYYASKDLEPAFVWALKASPVDESAKLLLATICLEQHSLALARQYALELVGNSDPGREHLALGILADVLLYSLHNQNPELAAKFGNVRNQNPRIAYAFMLEHGLGVERDLDLAIEQYRQCGERVFSKVADQAIRDHRYDDAFALYSAAEQNDVGSRIAAIRMIRHGLVEKSVKEALSLCAVDPSIWDIDTELEIIDLRDRDHLMFEKAELMLAQNKGRFSPGIVRDYEELAKNGDPRAQARLIQYSRQPNVTYQLIVYDKKHGRHDLIADWEEALHLSMNRVQLPENQGALSASLRFELDELMRDDHTKLAEALNTIIRDESRTSETVKALEGKESILLTQYAEFVKEMSPEFNREALERVAKLVFATNKVSIQQIGALEYALAVMDAAPKQAIFLKEFERISTLIDPDEVAAAVNSLRDFSLGKNLMPDVFTYQIQNQITAILRVLWTTYQHHGQEVLDARKLFALANIVQNTVNPTSMEGVRKLAFNIPVEIRDSMVDRFRDDLKNDEVTLDDLIVNYFGENLVPQFLGEQISDEDYNQWVRPLAQRYNAQDVQNGPEQLLKITRLLLNNRYPTLQELAQVRALLA